MIEWSKIDTFNGNSTSPMLCETRACPVCGSNQWRTLNVYDEFLFYTDDATQPKVSEIRDVQCKSCFALFRNPCFTTDGFDILFAEAGQSYGSTDGRPNEQVEWLENHGLLPENKTVLDIGCYYGRFLNTLPADFQRVGVEIDANVVEEANAHNADTGVKIYQGPFEGFSIPVTPGLVTMFHVLEHLPNPKAVLEHLRSLAEPSTRLIVEVPIVEFGRTNDIHGFFSIQHLTHFSKNTLTQLVNSAGWEIIVEEQMPDYNGHRIALKPTDTTPEPTGDIADLKERVGLMAAWMKSLGERAETVHDFDLRPRMVIWGGGMHTEVMYQWTDIFALDPNREFIIVDSDPTKQGKTWRGIKIHHPDVIPEIDWDSCTMVISSYGSQERIAEAAIERGVPEHAIQRIYETVRVY